MAARRERWLNWEGNLGKRRVCSSCYFTVGQMRMVTGERAEGDERLGAADQAGWMCPGDELVPTLWQGRWEPTNANTIPDEWHSGSLKQKSAAYSRDLESNAAGDGATSKVGQMSQHRDRRQEKQYPLRDCQACQINRVESGGQGAAGDKTKKLTWHWE